MRRAFVNQEMNIRRARCVKCGTEYDSAHCPRCESQNGPTKKVSPLSMQGKESVKIPVRPPASNFVLQIASVGVRPDNVYEAKMFLAREVDMSSVKITVKGNNLRVSVRQPLSSELASQLPGIVEDSPLGDLVKKTVKHCENLLIPDVIDGEKLRAIVDNEHRMLVLTAPMMKPSKAAKKTAAKNALLLSSLS